MEYDRGLGAYDSWATLSRERWFQPDFALNDGTGTVVVPSAQATMLADLDHVFLPDIYGDLDPHRVDYLIGRGLQNRASKKTLRFREGVLQQGLIVAAVGQVSREPDPNPLADGGTYREPPHRLTLTVPRRGLLLVSDDPNAMI